MTDWPVKTLGDISEISYGYTESAKSEAVGPKFLRITDIKDRGVNWDDVPYCPIDDVQLNRHRLGDGDIVFARTGATTGKSFLVAKPPLAVCASYLIRLRTDKKIVSPDFLNLNFQTNGYWKQVNEGMSGAAQGGFNASKLGALEIPVPTLEEQKRIVALLDATTARVTELTACYEQARTHANNLSESLYDDCFEQQSAGTPLGDIADLNGGYAFKSSDYTESGIFVLRTLNIDAKGDVTKRKPAFVSKARLGEFDRFKLFAGDILFVMVGATLGKTGVVKEADLPALLNQNMWVIRAKNDLIDPRYLYFVFKKYSKTLLSGAAGTARAFVKRDDFRNLMIPVPPLAEQKRIVARLDSMKAKTSEMVAAYDSKLQAAKNLRQSILEAAFAGDL